MTVYILVAAVIVCVAFSAFFSSSEMAVSSSNKIRLENMAEKGDEKAAEAVMLSERYDDTLSTILVGNNLVNIAASSLGSILAMILLKEGYEWVSTLVLTVVVIIFGETIPKITAKKNATAYAVQSAGFLHFLLILFRPVTWTVVKLTNLLTSGLKGEQDDDDEAAVEELHSIIETAEDENVIDEDSSELVIAAIDFADISASEVMTARVDILAIDIDDDRPEILRKIGGSSFSRIPVYEDSIDNIIGILSMNHLLKAMIDDKDIDIRSLMMPPCYVYKTMKLPDVLSLLRESQQHLAIVTDEYGGTMGIVSLEDVLEELVGDIWDETDTVETPVKEVNEGIYEVDGDETVSELLDLMGWDEDDFDFESETIGGWCIEMIGRFPEAGQSFTWRSAEFTVLEVDERRVLKVRIQKNVETGE